MDKTPQTHFWNIDRIMNLLIGVLIAGAVLWAIYYLRDALLPFFVACVIAYLLQPLVSLNRRVLHLHNRVVPSVLTVAEVTLVLVVAVKFTLPSIIGQLDELGRILGDISSGKLKLPKEYAPVFNAINKYFDPHYLTQLLSSMRIEELLRRSGSILQESAEVVIRVLAWALTLIYILFILIDYPRIANGFKLIVPEKYRPAAMSVVDDIKSGMNHYFRGQGLVALCAMVFYCIGFSIVGLPLAIPMGLLVGILYMIPYFQYITLIPVAAICMVYSLGGDMQFLPELGKCILVYVVSQCICDYIITPHVMGRELGLNPAIILLSLSVWGALLGIIGMIIALPVTALIFSYYQKYISNRK